MSKYLFIKILSVTMDTKAEPTPFDQKLLVVFIATFASMTVFEFAWQFISPLVPDWRSNLITILFVSGLAVIIAYFPLDSYYTGHLQVLSEMERCRSVETALRKSESRLGSIIRVAPIGIGVVSRGIIRTVNNQLCHITGYTAEELTGRSASLLFPVQEDYDHIVRENEAQIARKGTGEVETRWRKKDGTVIDVLLSSTLVDPSDASPAITFTVLDITEQKRAETALRESEEKFRIVVENSLDGILIVDMTGVVLFRNRAEANIFDLESETSRIGAKNVMEHVAPESRAQVLHDLRQVAMGIDSYPVNYQAVTATGRRVWIEAIGKRIPFRNSPALLVSMRDITARKQMEQAILRANRQLNLLSGITRHDINNQLQSLNGFAELLRMKMTDPSCDDYFSRITEASSRITAMIRFTKEYEEIGIHAAVWQDLRSLVDRAAESATPGQVALINDLPPGTEVFADPLIVKVFFNLIENAIRHGRKITTVRFSSGARDLDLIIACEDDGDGVAREEKERIFDRGFGRNTGLGLSLSREILDITGIAIRETGDPGSGARFEILVPKGAGRSAGEKSSVAR